jgi:transcription initiation factor TFIIIB Brf1 subunit/transcription initiation factor TFIIB
MCPKMTHVIFDDFAGEIVCRICGIVIESHTSQRSTASIFEISIPTTCGYNNFHKTLPILKQMLSQINATNTMIQTAYKIGLTLAKKNTMIKYSHRVHAAYIVYLSCRLCNRILNPNYLAKIFDISKKHLKNTIFSTESTGIEKIVNPLSQRQVITGLLSKTCNDIGVYGITEMIQKYDDIQKHMLFTGKSPRTIAAYIICTTINSSSLQIHQNTIFSSLDVNKSSVWRLSKHVKNNLK